MPSIASVVPLVVRRARDLGIKLKLSSLRDAISLALTEAPYNKAVFSERKGLAVLWDLPPRYLVEAAERYGLDVTAFASAFEVEPSEEPPADVPLKGALTFPVFLTAYWKAEDGTSGRETLKTMIGRPLRELARTGHGAGPYDLGYFRLDADDHLETHDDLVSQDVAQLLVSEAARAIHFLDASNLTGRVKKWSYAIRDLPHQDHAHQWVHVPTGAEVLADEPYHLEYLLKKRRDWAKKSGLHFATTPVRLYDHGRGREPMFFASFSKEALEAICSGLKLRSKALSRHPWSGESAAYSPIFRSPAQQANKLRKRGRPRPVKYDEPTNGALPYLFSPLSSDLSWRPAAAMPMEAHDEVGRLLNGLMLLDESHFGTLSRVRQLLDSWLGCELNKGDVLGSSTTKVYWRLDTPVLPPTTSWQMALDRIEELLAMHYPNCRPLREVQRKLLSARTQLQRKQDKGLLDDSAKRRRSSR